MNPLAQRLSAFILTISFNLAAAKGEEATRDLRQAEVKEVARVVALIKSDTRSPTMTNISGAWKPNPQLAGPGDIFTLTETNGKIQGSGVFSGCLLEYAYTISGRRMGNAVTLKFESTGLVKDSSEKKFFIVKDKATVVLAESGSDRYPMVSFSSTTAR